MAAFIVRAQDSSIGSLSMKGTNMKALGILKGACTVVGVATLAVSALMVALHTFTSLELPRIER